MAIERRGEKLSFVIRYNLILYLIKLFSLFSFPRLDVSAKYMKQNRVWI